MKMQSVSLVVGIALIFEFALAANEPHPTGSPQTATTNEKLKCYCTADTGCNPGSFCNGDYCSKFEAKNGVSIFGCASREKALSSQRPTLERGRQFCVDSNQPIKGQVLSGKLCFCSAPNCNFPTNKTSSEEAEEEEDADEDEPQQHAQATKAQQPQPLLHPVASSQNQTAAGQLAHPEPKPEPSKAPQAGNATNTINGTKIVSPPVNAGARNNATSTGNGTAAAQASQTTVAPSDDDKKLPAAVPVKSSSMSSMFASFVYVLMALASALFL